MSRVTQQVISRVETGIQVSQKLANSYCLYHTAPYSLVRSSRGGGFYDIWCYWVLWLMLPPSNFLPFLLCLRGLPLLRFHPIPFCSIKERETDWQECTVINCNTISSSAFLGFHCVDCKIETSVDCKGIQAGKYLPSCGTEYFQRVEVKNPEFSAHFGTDLM